MRANTIREIENNRELVRRNKLLNLYNTKITEDRDILSLVMSIAFVISFIILPLLFILVVLIFM